MKKIMLIIAMVTFMIAGAKAQSPFDKFYEKYAGQDGFTSVNISKDMFQMFQSMAESGKDAETKEMGKVIDQLTGLKMVSCQLDSVKPGRAATFYSEAAGLFPGAVYKELMTVNDGGNNIRFLTKQDGPGKISEMVMLLRGKEEAMVLSMTGHIDLANISKLSKSMNIPGMENLKHVHSKKK